MRKILIFAALLTAMVLLGAAVVLIGAKLTGAEELRWLMRRRPSG